MDKKITADLDVYLVGGAVRDKLLGREIIERDWLVIGASVEQMLQLGFSQVGKDFPVFLHPETKEEYALARTERKQGKGYTGFVCYAEPDVTIEQDLLRRDLTVNAIAQAEDGSIVDPFNGQTDIKNKVLRHVSSAFAEDPLRVLRVARFAARYYYLGFSIAPETLQLMTDMALSGELNNLTPDRVWKEFSRSLTENNPEVFIEVLRATGALKVLWPSLDALWGVPNPEQHHGEIDSGVHTLMVLKQAVKFSKEVSVRFASLCHDLGKGLTPKDQWPSHHGHEKSGLALVQTICESFKVPNQVKRLSLLVCEFHLHCHRAFELKPVTVLNLFDKLDAWRKQDDFELFLFCCHADISGRLGKEQSAYPQADYLRSALNACKEITAKPFVEQGLKGPAIKQAMNAEKVEVIALVAQNFKNNKGE
ncbi:multifunctional CCA addition/repair protein [Thalassomonas sp. M1454]|uniref:multifunctional CCA addition/repair protein n=1 Tax=Thalassomonas sp. M1454 TaxID=2594477 RepID=UPI00117F83AA|nr:multifunctional CCA addition/repair protein [Thalassomonas sp. M1454]TRX53906.1 multifunctional CCA addition/repair protein [Thalassomonas sp. M1454]